MSYQVINGIPVWGAPQENAVAQMANAARTAYKAALMADHHLGYSVPIGGVIAYKGQVSPSGVGYDIACGNKAVRLDARASDIAPRIKTIMDDVWRHISFGVGRKNATTVDHALFDDDAWSLPVAAELKDMAREQLGTVGSGNHFISILKDEQDRIWIANHFGSRGLGHRLATHFIKEGGGKDGIDVAPVVLDVNSSIGADYLAAMHLAGRYAYAGRDWVCDEIARLIGAPIVYSVHNHHNYAWQETHEDEDLWVVRKGATPARPGQRGFVGATMGEPSVILEGVESAEGPISLYSTVHGSGRILSRTQAAGRIKWIKGKPTRITEGQVSQGMMDDWVRHKAGVELRGAGVDESPHCYKRLTEVLEAHRESVRVIHTLTPLGVAMAGAGEIDPYKD